MKKTQVYSIIKKVKAGENAYDQRNLPSIASVAAAINNDRRTTVAKIVAATGLTTGTVHRILKDELGLAKKS